MLENVEVVKETIVRHVVSAPTTQRRRLRLFSGKVPVPNGEVDFGVDRHSQWGEAKDGKEAEKLRRLFEALLPPASDIEWSLGKSATTQEAYEGLVKACGITADGMELYFRFTECFQKGGEAASDYLLRLHDLLSKAMDGGGVLADQVDKVQAHQYVRGCLYDESLLQALDLKRRPSPPDFVTVLHEIRQLEQAERQKDERRQKGQ